MIIAKLPITPYSKYYLKLVQAQVKEYIKTYENVLKVFLTRYTEEQINNAIKEMQVVGYNIYAPTTQVAGEIIRTLEYGSSYLKSLKIISRSVRKVLKEVDSNEYVI